MAGVEPTSRRSERRVLPMDDIAMECGRRGSNPQCPVWKTGALPITLHPHEAEGTGLAPVSVLPDARFRNEVLI